MLALLAVCVLGMGLYPLPFTEVMHASVDNLLTHVAHQQALTPLNDDAAMNFVIPDLYPAAAGDLPAGHGLRRSCWSICSSSRAGAADLRADPAHPGRLRRRSPSSPAAGKCVLHLQQHVRRRPAWPTVLKLMTYLAVIVVLVYCRAAIWPTRDLYKGEFFVLALFAMLGMMVMISANHFLTALPRPGTAVAVAVRAGRAATATRRAPPKRR